MSLYRQYRPQTFDQVVGQDEAVTILRKQLEEKSVNPVILFEGDSGTGKTTLAYILAKELGVLQGGLTEVNTADERAIDSIRAIIGEVLYKPIHGGPRVYILDEVIQYPGPTQKAALALLDKPPENTYFFLCSSRTDTLIKPFLDRCFRIHLKPLSTANVHKILTHVAKRADIELGTDAANEIARRAGGSARKALQLLEAAMAAEDQDDQLELIGAAGQDLDLEEEGKGFLGSLLLYKSPWEKVARAIAKIDRNGVEGVRMKLLAYCEKVLLDPKAVKLHAMANLTIKVMQDNFMAGGRPALTSACWTVCQNKNS